MVQSDDIHFEPVVQLEEVEVKTGEEDETCVYSQRSKLYRYTDNQWKERGVGEMKILKHNKTGSVTEGIVGVSFFRVGEREW